MSQQPYLFSPMAQPVRDDTVVSVVAMREGLMTEKRGAIAQGMRGGSGGMSVCVLASGSGGNATVVRYRGQAILVDAGLGPVSITKRLHQAGLMLSDIRGICVTHLDTDHFRPTWPNTLVGYGIPIYLHRWHVDDLMKNKHASRLVRANLIRPFDQQPFEPIAGMSVRCVRLRHDDKGTTGFSLDTPVGRIGYATDLGCVPREMIELFAGVDLLAIESNYDPVLQRSCGRPIFLQRRIMGGAGHLSNDEAFAAVQQIIEHSPDGPPNHVVLLHRSSQANSAALVKQVFAQDPRLQGKVVLTQQRRRTRWLQVTRRASATMGQMSLFERRA